MAGVQINRKQLLVELGSSEPILKKEAEAIIRQQFFDPAVAELKESFEEHPVTREIRAGPETQNVSETLEAPFGDPPVRKDGSEVPEHDYLPPNLFAFIGFDQGTDPTEQILKRLDPSNKDGPKMVYQGKDKDNLKFRWLVKAPDSSAIYEATPLPWAEGVSWAKRIEQGIPGIGFYLNAPRESPDPSRSGGGIQVQNQLRTGRFKPTSYLSSLFNQFLRRASSGRGPAA